MYRKKVLKSTSGFKLTVGFKLTMEEHTLMVSLWSLTVGIDVLTGVANKPRCSSCSFSEAFESKLQCYGISVKLLMADTTRSSENTDLRSG